MGQTEARVREVDDFWAWHELAWKEGWTDGLPVAPPTPEVVEELIAATGLPRGHSLGAIGPSGAEATIELVAVNAAMAGCWPSLMPCVLAAIECVLDPAFNLTGVQATTNPCAPLVIVNGPVRTREGFATGDGALGGGSRANAALGRALRLVLWNVGGAKPGLTDMATLGQPGKWGYCIAENEEDSPWATLAENRGFARDEDVVTVFACDAPHAIFVPGGPERILKIFAQSLPRWSLNVLHAAGQMLLIVGPRTARALASHGMGQADFRSFIHERARFDCDEMLDQGILEAGDETKSFWGTLDETQRLEPRSGAQVPMVVDPEDIHVVVTGGLGQWWCAFSPGWGSYGGYAQSRAVKGVQ